MSGSVALGRRGIGDRPGCDGAGLIGIGIGAALVALAVSSPAVAGRSTGTQP
jgi:hypothetical protein